MLAVPRGHLSVVRFGNGRCKRRAVVWDLAALLAAIATGGNQ